MAGLTQPRCSAHKRFGDDDPDGDKKDPICDVPHSITDTQDPLVDDPDDIAEPEVSFRDDKAE